MVYFKKSLELHEKLQWKLEIKSKIKIKNKDDLSVAYTPGVAEPCKIIVKDPSQAKKLTIKWNTVAIVSDGSAVLWLWNIWPNAALPVMEWKAVLFKEFANINAFPIVLNTQDTEEIIKTIKIIAPSFWWINLEDISAPRCFEIEERLKKELDIPVFHDDQHWTAIVVLAGLINALKITGKKKDKIKVVVNWLWAAWTAIIKLLREYWIKNIIALDSKWAICNDRSELNIVKKEILEITNLIDKCGKLEDIIEGADVFIWVSVWNILKPEMIKKMNKDPIIFAIANPVPEIMPCEAKKAWAKIVATWRSDFPNQINNVLVFPWIFKWALENQVRQITNKHKIAAAEALANYVKNPTEDYIIPSPLDKKVVDVVANVIN